MSKNPYSRLSRMLCLVTALVLLPTLALAAWQDGVYQDKGKGYHGDLVVTITIRDGKLTEIKAESVSDQKDEFLETATAKLIPSILEQNGVDGVDVVSTATYSSNGILEAVRGVLVQASDTPLTESPSPQATVAPRPTVDPATAEVFTGLGSTSNFRVGPGKDSTDVQVYSFNVVMANCLFDKDGKILHAKLDIYEVSTPNYEGESMPHFSGWPNRQGYNITDHATKQVSGESVNTETSAGEEVSAWVTKRERGASYGMNPNNEWFQQMDAYEQWMVGKTPNEIRSWFARYTSVRNGRPIKANSENEDDQKALAAMTDEEKAQLADVVSMATMSLSDSHGLILEAIEKAYENRVPVGGVGIQ